MAVRRRGPADELVQSRFDSAIGSNRLEVTRWRNPPTTVRSSETSAQVQPESSPAKILSRIFPAARRRSFCCGLKFISNTAVIGPPPKRKEALMFNALLPHFIFTAILLLVLAIFTIGKIRYTHIVSEGYAGLLYHKGKFVRVLGPGRHVRWGRHFTIRWVDVRRASLLIPGQDVLTADNVGLKLSLLVSYQVTDPAKATHDTQNWPSDLHNAAQLALRAVVGGL